MPDYNELRNICEEFVDNIDGWCELDEGDMIDRSLVEMKAALLEVESTEKSDNTAMLQLLCRIVEEIESKGSFVAKFNSDFHRELNDCIAQQHQCEPR